MVTIYCHHICIHTIYCHHILPPYMHTHHYTATIYAYTLSLVTIYTDASTHTSTHTLRKLYTASRRSSIFTHLPRAVYTYPPWSTYTRYGYTHTSITFTGHSSVTMKGYSRYCQQSPKAPTVHISLCPFRSLYSVRNLLSDRYTLCVRNLYGTDRRKWSACSSLVKLGGGLI